FGDEVPHGSFVVELYFAFRGMNVHVHRRRINFQEQTANRIAAFHQRGVVAFKERVIEPAIFDGPAIYEEMLFIPCGTRHTRLADKTPEAKGGQAGGL